METPTLALLSVFLLSLITTWTEGAITCQAMTSSYETKVTCFFHVDLSTTMHNFNVHLYYPDLQAKPVNMLTCNWFSSDTIRCVKGPGVTFNNIVSDQLTLRGPSSLDKVGGQFACDVVPSSDHVVEPCTLVFNESTKPVSPVTEAEKEMDHERRPSGLSIATAVVVFTCLICFAAYLLFTKRAWFIGKCTQGEAQKEKDKTKATNPESAEMSDVESQRDQSAAARARSTEVDESTRTPEAAQPLLGASEQPAPPLASSSGREDVQEEGTSIDVSNVPLPNDGFEEKREQPKKEQKKQDKKEKKVQKQAEEARKKKEKADKKKRELEEKERKKEEKKNKA